MHKYRSHIDMTIALNTSKKKAVSVSALVMLSGGLDSAVALFWALNRGYEVVSITFDYYLRGARERKSAVKLAKYMGTKQRIVNVKFMKEIEEVKDLAQNSNLRSAPSAYIPSRNLMFYSIATSIAELTATRYIIGGHNRDDAKIFPDSSNSFFEQFNRTSAIGLLTGGNSGRVILPLAGLSKSEVVALGAKLGVPFDLTWSCYKSQSSPCGNCSACLQRIAAFRKARIKDTL
jgi:7-cyano-7-deazaguanine synthase